MYYEEKKKSKEKIIMYGLMIVIITLLLVLILKSEVGNNSVSYDYNAQKTNFDESVDDVKEENNTNTVKSIEESVDAIVGISKLKQNGSSIFINNAEEKLGLGSGVIITENGYILTNQHVAGNKYSSCYVMLDDGNTYDGNVVWSDSNIDLAIVKINKSNLKYIELGNSDTLRLAEDVYAIGNPLGMEFQKTVTKGIVSSLNRTIKIEDNSQNVYMEDLIQIDATINEGNSGGALINSIGELIGINSVKISNAEGIGFAVPINVVKPIINKFINNGKFEEACLGIFGYDKEAIRYLNDGLDIENGIYVAQITSDGPLLNSNVKEGDIITQIDDVKISKMNDLKQYIYGKNPGDKVVLYVERGKNKFTVDVTLSSKI